MVVRVVEVSSGNPGIEVVVASRPLLVVSTSFIIVWEAEIASVVCVKTNLSVTIVVASVFASKVVGSKVLVESKGKMNFKKFLTNST